MKLQINKNRTIYLTIKLILIMVYVTLSSCKSSKSGCDAYGSNYELKTDSTIVKVQHCHIPKESYCYYTTDTIYLKK